MHDPRAGSAEIDLQATLDRLRPNDGALREAAAERAGLVRRQALRDRPGRPFADVGGAGLAKLDALFRVAEDEEVLGRVTVLAVLVDLQVRRGVAAKPMLRIAPWPFGQKSTITSDWRQSACRAGCVAERVAATAASATARAETPISTVRRTRLLLARFG